MNTTTSLKDKTSAVLQTPHTDRGWVRALARLNATTLDRRLAAGEAPSTDRVLAARADQITDPEKRSKLADDWEHLLRTAHQPIAPRSPRLPLQSAKVIAAEHHVRELVAMIRGPVGVDPRGIAIARLLLSDGTGPLYNPRRAGELVPTLQSAVSPSGR